MRANDPAGRACLAWLDAIQREDLEAMKTSSVFKTFDNVDFKLWKASRPLHPKMVSGYATDAAATIQLRGRSPAANTRPGPISWSGKAMSGA